MIMLPLFLKMTKFSCCLKLHFLCPFPCCHWVPFFIVFTFFFQGFFASGFPPCPHSLFLLSFVAFTVMVKIFRRGPGCTEGLSEEPKCSDAFVLLGNSRCPRCPGVLGQLGVSEPNWGSQNSFAQIPGKPNMFWLDCESPEFKDNICSVLSPPCVVKLTPASLADIGVGMPTGME